MGEHRGEKDDWRTSAALSDLDTWNPSFQDDPVAITAKDGGRFRHKAWHKAHVASQGIWKGLRAEDHNSAVREGGREGGSEEQHHPSSNQERHFVLLLASEVPRLASQRCIPNKNRTKTSKLPSPCTTQEPSSTRWSRLELLSRRSRAEDT